MRELHALRSSLKDDTNEKVRTRNTNTGAKTTTIVSEREADSTVCMEVNDRAQDDVRGRSTNPGGNDEEGAVPMVRKTNNEASAVAEVRKREAMNAEFSIREIEEAFNTFNGDDEYDVKRWVLDIEQSAAVFKWNDVQQLVYGKRLLRGSAKLFLRTIAASSWVEMRDRMIEKFGRRTTMKIMARRVGTNKQYDGRCYSCGEAGHFALNCSRKEDGVKCFGCNEFGHRSADCAKKENGVKMKAGMSETANAKEEEAPASRHASSEKECFGAYRLREMRNGRLDFARNSSSSDNDISGKDVKAERRGFEKVEFIGRR